MHRLLIVLGLLFSAPVPGAIEVDRAEWEALRGLAIGERTVLSVPDARDRVRRIDIERFDPYAADARIVAIERSGVRELPRSRRLHFLAREGEALGLSMNPDGSEIAGLAWVDGDLMELRGTRHGAGARLWLQAMPERDAEGQPIAWSCSDSPTHGDAQADFAALRASLTPAGRAPTVASRQAVVAVDTDNEFMGLKFSDNTTNATNYLADLFTGMNVLY